MSELWIPAAGREAATVCGGRLRCCKCFCLCVCGDAFLRRCEYAMKGRLLNDLS